jgi:ribosomal protein S18 acetylase RimI-like enzyme
VRVERVGPQDWADWRTLRLQALLAAPQAFCSRYEDALAWPEARWRERLAGDGGCWLARDGAPVAMAAAWQQDGRFWLGSVYVVPAARGRGLLEALLERAVGWAREQGGLELALEVHEDNAPARRAYRRLGFVETGERRPYPLGPERDELLMVLEL